MLRDYVYGVLRDVGLSAGTLKDIAGFMQGVHRGGGKERQAQSRSRTGPTLPKSADAPMTPAGRTSPAKPATSNQRAIQEAVAQSDRAESAARAIMNQMARAGTYATNNDIADLISGSTKPLGPKQKLPGTNLRLLNLPRA